MLKASVSIATSVDGFIARSNGAIDWLPAGGGGDHGYNAFMATVAALIIGRNTFETVLGFGSWPYGTKPVFVLRRTSRGTTPRKRDPPCYSSTSSRGGKLCGPDQSHCFGWRPCSAERCRRRYFM
jgi:dihydrofolate reductase